MKCWPINVCYIVPLALFTVSVLPVAMHMDLSLGKAFHSSYDKSTRAIGWQDLLAQLKFIRNANPHRAVRRLTFSSGVKLGSMTNLSSATAGLLSHVDFTRAKGVNKLKFDDLAVNLPGLRGLAVRTSIQESRWPVGSVHTVISPFVVAFVRHEP